jgi:hypothetical protein
MRLLLLLVALLAPACASAPPLAPVCPTLAETEPQPEASPRPWLAGLAAAQPADARLDRRAEASPLDRSRSASLEGFSADGQVALLRIDDSARGRSFLLLSLDGEAPPRHLPADTPAQEQAALRALGRAPALDLSAQHPVTAAHAMLLERPDAHAVMLVAPEAERPTLLALLPRSPDATPAGHLLAWAPGGAHLFVRLRERSRETPRMEADRWFSLRTGPAMPPQAPVPGQTTP